MPSTNMNAIAAHNHRRFQVLEAGAGSSSVMPTYLDRESAVKWLNAVHGLPITRRYFGKISAPGIGGGPKADLIWGGRHLYKPQNLLAWAMSRAEVPGKKMPHSEA
jgi:hypothetical protein